MVKVRQTYSPKLQMGISPQCFCCVDMHFALRTIQMVLNWTSWLPHSCSRRSELAMSMSSALSSCWQLVNTEKGQTAKTVQKKRRWIYRKETLLFRPFWVVAWLVCDNFEFGAKNWPGMVPKWPQNDPKWPQVFKVTSETISIEILPLLRSFWVVTWLVCDKFEFGDKNGPKLLRNGQKWPKIVRNGQKWLLSLKKTRIDLVYVTSGPFWSLKGGWVTFFQSRGQNGPKIQFCHREKFFMKQ